MIPFLRLLSPGPPAVGPFIQSASPEFLEASAYAGFRFAAVDLEHAPFGTETLAQLIRAGEVRTYVLDHAKPRIAGACRILTVSAAAGFSHPCSVSSVTV